MTIGRGKDMPEVVRSLYGVKKTRTLSDGKELFIWKYTGNKDLGEGGKPWVEKRIAINGTDYIVKDIARSSDHLTITKGDSIGLIVEKTTLAEDS